MFKEAVNMYMQGELYDRAQPLAEKVSPALAEEVRNKIMAATQSQIGTQPVPRTAASKVPEVERVHCSAQRLDFYQAQLSHGWSTPAAAFDETLQLLSDKPLLLPQISQRAVNCPQLLLQITHHCGRFTNLHCCCYFAYLCISAMSSCVLSDGDDLADRGDVDGAMSVYYNQGDWPKLMELARKSGDKSVKKYSPPYIQFLLEQGQVEEAVKTAMRDGLSEDHSHASIYAAMLEVDPYVGEFAACALHLQLL